MPPKHPVSNGKYVVLQVQLIAMGTAKTGYVASPVDGEIKAIHGVVNVAVDANNVITSSVAGAAITGGGFTLTTAETAGLGKSAYPTAANSVLRGQAIGITTDGGGGAGEAEFTILIETV